ncbi:phosphopentomutase/phosphoglucosamine mutase [Haloarculaceae archaeon H-GB1-1]|nr:phosphopentomutase/phosphoglucosamine mutase [Haloarculaceae archaeon H-GB1-1]
MDLFGTAGIRGDVRETVTPSLALAVGRAAGAVGEAFVLARDGRETSPALAAAMEAGLESAGADVLRAGQLPTPALAYASRGRRGVMITASHNPPHDNGIKLFVDGEEYGDDAEATIEERVAADEAPTEWTEWGSATRVSPLDDYRSAVAAYVRQHGATPDGLTVAVDCGNGMASLATPQVLRDLGADVQALNANVDGHFPGRESKPTPESLADLRAFVADGDTDFGIGHDGDADRIVIVDGDGDVVHEDTILAVLAEHYVRDSDAGDPVVVTTPNASARIDERVRDAGGRVERVRLGALHEGIADAHDAGTSETEVVFAGEPWKHVHTDFGGWIDGVASAALITRLLAAESLGSRRDPVSERPYRKVSVECPNDRKAPTMSTLETTLPETFPDASVDTQYGVRLELPDGSWTLVRPSGTEPYVRVYAESDAVDSLVEAVVDRVEQAVATAA